MRFQFRKPCPVCAQENEHWHSVDPRPVDVGLVMGIGPDAYGPQLDWKNAGTFDITGRTGGAIDELWSKEPAPTITKGLSREVWPVLLKYLEGRVTRGEQKYGVRLHTHDGRNSLHDALDESVDQTFYLMKRAMEEQDERIEEMSNAERWRDNNFDPALEEALADPKNHYIITPEDQDNAWYGEGMEHVL